MLSARARADCLKRDWGEDAASKRRWLFWLHMLYGGGMGDGNMHRHSDLPTLERSAEVQGAMDIVRYETATGARTVLVLARQLVPPGIYILEVEADVAEANVAKVANGPRANTKNMSCKWTGFRGPSKAAKERRIESKKRRGEAKKMRRAAHPSE